MDNIKWVGNRVNQRTFYKMHHGTVRLYPADPYDDTTDDVWEWEVATRAGAVLERGYSATMERAKDNAIACIDLVTEAV